MTKKRKLFWQIPLLLLLVAGTIYIARQQQNMPYRQDEGKIFGTYYHITYQSDRDLHQAILQRLQQVDSSLSMFNDSSTISRVNRSTSSSPFDVSDDPMFCEVVTMAMSVSDATDGAFDITVAPLVNAWGFGFKNDTEPTKAAIDSLLAFTGYRQVTWQRKQLVKKHPQTMLDCSAIAKGYGTDMVARVLKENDVQNYMVEIGGEVVAEGVNPQKEPWRIGVTKPMDDPTGSSQELQAVLSLPHGTTWRALATSGNYRNFYYKDGQRYAHTIDPKTGYPVQHSLLSATVVAKSCALADAYATAFMVMGLDKAITLLDRHSELMAYLIYSDPQGRNAVWCSPKLQKMIEE